MEYMGFVMTKYSVRRRQRSCPQIRRAFLPECNARYRWYKRHCAFISPIPFSDTVPASRLFVHESWKLYYTVWSLAKTHPTPLVVETEVTIYRGAFWVHSTVAPPSGQRKSQDTVQQQQHSLCVYIPVATAEKYFHPIQTYDNI